MVGKQHSSDLVIADAHDGTKASRLMLIILAFTEKGLRQPSSEKSSMQAVVMMLGPLRVPGERLDADSRFPALLRKTNVADAASTALASWPSLEKLLGDARLRADVWPAF